MAMFSFPGMKSHLRQCVFSGHARIPCSVPKYAPFFLVPQAPEYCRAGKVRARCWPSDVHGKRGRLAANLCLSRREIFQQALDAMMERHSMLFAALKD